VKIKLGEECSTMVREMNKNSRNGPRARKGWEPQIYTITSQATICITLTT